MVARAKKAAEPPNPEGWARLESFVDGLYDELDKLSRKNPIQNMSSLATSRVNRAIRDARTLMDAHDDYIADLREFDPKSAYNTVRDGVLVLREIRQGLARLDERFDLSAAIRG
jgi:hypothetical protein